MVEPSAGREAWCTCYLCCVTNHHQPGSLQQHPLTTSQFCRVDVRAQLSLVFCRGSREAEIQASAGLGPRLELSGNLFPGLFLPSAESPPVLVGQKTPFLAGRQQKVVLTSQGMPPSLAYALISKASKDVFSSLLPPVTSPLLLPARGNAAFRGHV